uniref:Receptor-interacting serine-threonine kinase 3 n=1 Tax=Neogobius melanostomus TaxID=47308 RepID=A0A8C6S851_9GOBI
MDLMSCPAPIMVNDSCLDSWTRIGAGGFGQIYKARHKRLCCDVAIKLLHYDDGGSSLMRELDMMRQGSSPYVIQVLGVFRGLSPVFMERGCLATLQERLCGALPWPLVFRMAHQVALGINFLHNLRPPLLHLDLKPSNVLLDSYLKAKLTDFGLAKVYHSMSRVSKRDTSTEEGTLSYMPPEAFDLSYTPTKASDIYSYGILLWSIVTGKQPYPHALSCIVRLRIPQGDRPSVEEIRVQAAGIAGLTRLQDLMEQCWEMRPSARPSSYDCTTATEELFKLHKHSIHGAVLQVVETLVRICLLTFVHLIDVFIQGNTPGMCLMRE